MGLGLNGDIIFIQTILKDFIKEGYEIIYPVKKEFYEGLKYAYPYINFIPDTFIQPEIFNIKEDCIVNGVRILPIRWSESLMGRPYKLHMESKYAFFGKDWKTWKQSMYCRNEEKENELFELLGLNDGEPYNLKSTFFGSNAQYMAYILVNNSYKDIELTNIAGYSLFDWSKVIENATTIHAASSSSLYLFELLDLSAKEVHIYNRYPIEQNLDYVRFLFTKDYILHE